MGILLFIIENRIYDYIFIIYFLILYKINIFYINFIKGKLLYIIIYYIAFNSLFLFIMIKLYDII